MRRLMDVAFTVSLAVLTSRPLSSGVKDYALIPTWKHIRKCSRDRFSSFLVLPPDKQYILSSDCLPLTTSPIS